MMPPYSLLRNYVDLCCDVLKAHHDYFPYKQIFESAERKLDQEIEVTVHIVDDQNGVMPCRLCLSRDTELKITPIKCGQSDQCCGSCHTDTWIIERQFMDQVIKNPDDFLVNPALLDWGWLTDPDTDIQRNRHYTHNQSVSQADRPI